MRGEHPRSEDEEILGLIGCAHDFWSLGFKNVPAVPKNTWDFGDWVSGLCRVVAETCRLRQTSSMNFCPRQKPQLPFALLTDAVQAASRL